jgi:outer membrane protein assembly factor BamB
MSKFLLPLLYFSLFISVKGNSWPQFRGPTGQGHVIGESKLPLKWNSGEGVTWQTYLNGKAWSSPICVDDQLLLSNAIQKDGLLQLEIISISFKSGQIQWRKKLFEYENLPRIHKKNSFASPTPFYDEGRVFVHFGNLGTACLGLDGGLIWKQKLDYSPVHGSGASPVVFKDLLLLSADGAKDPCLYALDKLTGTIEWKAARDSNAKKNFSFCTPTVIEEKGKIQIISPASDYVFAYDYNGKQIWKFNYPNGYSVVPRPVYDDGIIYVSSGYDSPTLYAIRSSGLGDITKSHLVWETRKGVPRNSSVLVVNGMLFMAADNGVVSCLDALNGQIYWMERVAGSCSASLLLANGRIYFCDESGKTFIFKAQKEYSLIATNDIGERMLASPVAYQGSLLLRTEEGIWRIGK